MPIRDPNGNTIAAINLSTNLARHSAQAMVENFLPRLKKAREQIEQLYAGLKEENIVKGWAPANV